MISSSRLEEQDGDLSHVEVDEVFGFVSDVGAEIAADDAVPCGVVFLIEFFLDVGGDIFFDVELFEGDVGAIDGILLHFFIHVCVFDDCFSFGCGHSINR